MERRSVRLSKIRPLLFPPSLLMEKTHLFPSQDPVPISGDSDTSAQFSSNLTWERNNLSPLEHAFLFSWRTQSTCFRTSLSLSSGMWVYGLVCLWFMPHLLPEWSCRDSGSTNIRLVRWPFRWLGKPGLAEKGSCSFGEGKPSPGTHFPKQPHCDTLC